MTRLLALLLIAAMPAAAAQLPVFAGDPIDPTTGAPYIILPGVPLVNPGPDGRFGNRDDIIDPSIIGDVDLVVRTGGGYTGGPIPAPHAGVAAAPAVVAGGTATGSGTTVAFQGIVSDGQPPFVTGNRADRPRARRPAAARHRVCRSRRRRLHRTHRHGRRRRRRDRAPGDPRPRGARRGVDRGGVASGSLALTVGAPASAGGLGIVVTAGAATGTTPFLYFDGPWIATLLPYMPPLDPEADHRRQRPRRPRSDHACSPTSSWSSRRRSRRRRIDPDSRHAVRHPAGRHQPDGRPGAQRERPGDRRGVRQHRRSWPRSSQTRRAGYCRRSGRRARTLLEGMDDDRARQRRIRRRSDGRLLSRRPLR